MEAVLSVDHFVVGEVQALGAPGRARAQPDRVAVPGLNKFGHIAAFACWPVMAGQDEITAGARSGRIGI